MKISIAFKNKYFLPEQYQVFAFANKENGKN